MYCPDYITWQNNLRNELPEESMLHTPHVGEDKVTHVRESRDNRSVVGGVVSPQVTHEGFHHVDVHAVTRGFTSAWNVEVH